MHNYLLYITNNIKIKIIFLLNLNYAFVKNNFKTSKNYIRLYYV